MHIRASRIPARPRSGTAAGCLPHSRLAGAIAAQVPVQVRPGQQLPSPDQARDLLQNQPDLVRQLREKLAQSGLTEDQVRARLRAAGYPENFLDQYLAGADTTLAVRPGPRTLDAVQALGILSPQEADSLQIAGLAVRDVGLGPPAPRLAALSPPRLAARRFARRLARGDPAGRPQGLRPGDLPPALHPVRADGSRPGGRELPARARATCWCSS